MGGNKRVAVNALATYGRTLLRMGLGLFSARWILQSLGEVDYGLMGVVGSIIVFITFINTVFTGACARFFAFSIGGKNLNDLIKWFNTGLAVHLSIGVFVVVIGYPIGEYAIDNFINIPPDRLETAHWVFRFSLIAAFWSICITPFSAMYTATQNIAELTVWEVLSILCNFGLAYWLTTYQGNAWLMFSVFSVVLSVLIGSGQALRAYHVFSGCKIRFSEWHNWERIKEMFSFSGWTFFGSLGYLARANVPAILLNKFFSPIKFGFVNASYQVGNSLASYTQSMSTSLLGAFSPQITTLAGANDHQRMIATALNASKFGAFLTLLFAIPVALEADHLLILWLHEPPVLASAFCKIVLLQTILDNLTYGNMAGIIASGEIKWYQITTGLLCMASIPVSWVILSLGGGPLSVSWTIAFFMALCSGARVVFGKKLLNLSASLWARQTLLPIMIISLLSALAGSAVKQIMEPSFLRLITTSLTTPIMACGAGWFLLLNAFERRRLKLKISTLMTKLVNKTRVE